MLWLLTCFIRSTPGEHPGASSIFDLHKWPGYFNSILPCVIICWWHKMLQGHLDSLQLQQDLKSLATWSDNNHMKFNTSKFIHLRFNSKFSTSYHVNNIPITHSNTHRDLGLIISSNLSWKEHYSSITSKAYRSLGLYLDGRLATTYTSKLKSLFIYH